MEAAHATDQGVDYWAFLSVEQGTGPGPDCFYVHPGLAGDNCSVGGFVEVGLSLKGLVSSAKADTALAGGDTDSAADQVGSVGGLGAFEGGCFLNLLLLNANLAAKSGCLTFGCGLSSFVLCFGLSVARSRRSGCCACGNGKDEKLRTSHTCHKDSPV